MCGIAGVADLSLRSFPPASRCLAVMNRLQAHRGPDGEGSWVHPELGIGLGHRRLAVLDPETGAQPMRDRGGNWLTYNGEIYNYRELRRELGEHRFRTSSDTEVVLEAYRRWGEAGLERLRGMFAFALWDEERRTLFCARDRFGIKPFVYAVVDGVFYFASEAKALLPFLPGIETDVDALKDYLSFQFCLGGKTLFAGVRELQPGHLLRIRNGVVEERPYWTLGEAPDGPAEDESAAAAVRELLGESVALHLRADVPAGVYVSGGLDSSMVAALAAESGDGELVGFHGRFAGREAYDESHHAVAAARHAGVPLETFEIDDGAFVASIGRVVYHLDFPVAGPGSFPQFMVSALAASRRKVVLGGQGGDEIFGGYVRYLVAADLVSLRGYEQLEALLRGRPVEDGAARYFRLIDRGATLDGEIAWPLLGDYSPYEAFLELFGRAGGSSYFDAMTRFDTRTLLPALLHVEDRMSMAHGVESRVPLLDHRLVELAMSVPAGVRFRDGATKTVLRRAGEGVLPRSILNRVDKMGFPVPFTEWLTENGPVRDFVLDTLSSGAALDRPLVDNRRVAASISDEPRYGRRVWGMLCLELWQQTFHDREAELRRLALDEVAVPA